MQEADVFTGAIDVIDEVESATLALETSEDRKELIVVELGAADMDEEVAEEELTKEGLFDIDVGAGICEVVECDCDVASGSC